MTCTEYRRWLSSYIDGQLTESQRSELSAHLHRCDGCRAALMSLQHLLQGLRTMGAPQVPDLLPGIRQKLARQPWWRAALDRVAAPWSLPWHGLALGATTAVALIAVGLYLQRGFQIGVKSNADSIGQTFAAKQDYVKSKAPLSSEELPPPTDQASCEARGGAWGLFGLRQVPLCNLPTKDADKECTDGSQCESHACIADETVTASQPTAGRCYGWTTTLGTCLNRVFNSQASGVICED